MSANLSDSALSLTSLSLSQRVQRAIGLPLWIVIGFYAAQVLLSGAFFLLEKAGVSFVGIDSTVLQAVVAALIYLATIILVIGIPWWIKRVHTTKEDLGIIRLPTWMDFGLAPAGFIIYLLCTTLLVYLVSITIPHFDASQAQDTGFNNLSHYYEYLLAFVTLIIVAPIAEELLFRGYLYGKLRKVVPVWVAMLITSVIFGAIHGQWNVSIDVFAMSIVACSLREVSGSIWAGMMLHMLKNGLAFYVLFINPSLFHTIGG